MDSARYVPDRRTPAAPEEVIRATYEAARSVFKRAVTPSTVAVLTAQSALETGRWKSMHNWNLGNVKATEAWPGLYTCFRCNEIIGGKVVWFSPSDGGSAVPPGHPQTRFRAFKSLEEGVAAQLRFLTSARYAKALEAALAGDPDTFCTALKVAGYFTAALAPYKKAVMALYAEFLGLAEEIDQDRIRALDPKPGAPDPSKRI